MSLNVLRVNSNNATEILVTQMVERVWLQNVLSIKSMNNQIKALFLL